MPAQNSKQVMRYSTNKLKPSIPLYQGHSAKHRSAGNPSESHPEDKDFYARRISELELELQTLNVLEHPLRIIEICNQIRRLKTQISRSDA